MKNKLILISMILFMIYMIFIYNVEGFETYNNSTSIKSIDTIGDNDVKSIKGNREESEYDLLKMKYKDTDIPYDKNEGIYYLCKYNENYNFDLYYSKDITIKRIMCYDNDLLKIIAFNKNKYKIYDICLTELPIININLADKSNKKELISNDYNYGNVTILDNISNKSSLKITNESAKLKIRGLSSLSYEKKSYSLQFINPKSEGSLLIDNLLGFEENYMFALNSLYEDNSKIRDVLSLESWKNINEGDSNEINMKYVEVFINNEYYGLYGFSDVPNEYKLDIKDMNSTIYKINNNEIPALEYLNNNYLNKYTIEVTYPKTIYKGILEPLKKLMDLIYYSDDNVFSAKILEYINIDNCVDYFILMQLTSDYDGLWKNNVLKYDKRSKQFFKVPWDLDLTWGSHWDESNELYVEYNMSLASKLVLKSGNKNGDIPTYLEQRLWENNVGDFRRKVTEKWKELRNGFLETESFVAYSDQLYDKVTSSGAREREHKRWPNGGYSEDNSFIETFIKQRLEYLDTVFLKY